MGDDSVLSSVQTALRGYVTSDVTVTYAAVSLLAVVFLIEVLMTARTSLGSI